VTVVATGLGHAATVEDAPIMVVRKCRPRETNYRDFDTPAVQRRHSTAEEALGEEEALQELLDVPAFLRRQAN
jgi:hypothetical protein